MNNLEPSLKRHALGYFEIVDKPSAEELREHYAKKYYQEGRGSYELEYSDEELMYFQAKLEQRFALINKHLHLDETNSKKMLDVGCGEGYALSFFNNRGWQVKGIDFSSAGVISKNPDCINFLKTGDLFELLDAEIISGEKYDILWLQNVLEHVTNPIDLLVSLKKLVKTNGIAVITVPNDFSITQSELLALGHIEEKFWVVPPEHLSYFDIKGLTSIANGTGWERLEVLGDFPVDWYLFNTESNYIKNKSIGKSAHRARVQIENMLHKQAIDEVLNLFSALAKLGLGRNITIFLRPMD